MIELTYKYSAKDNPNHSFQNFDGISMPISLEQSKLLKISGPNNKGKTFFMYLFAHALRQYNNLKLDDKIIEKLEQDFNNESFELEYDLKIQVSENNFIYSTKSKDDKNSKISYEKDGKPISDELFNKDYEFVFEYPADVLERINEFVNIIKDKTRKDENELSDVSETLARFMTRLEQSKDLEKIRKLESDTTSNERAIENLDTKIGRLKTQQGIYKIIEAINSLTPITSKLDDISSDLLKYKSEIPKPKPKKPGSRTGGKSTKEKLSASWRTSISNCSSIAHNINIQSTTCGFKNQPQYSEINTKFQELVFHELIKDSFKETGIRSLFPQFVKDLNQYAKEINSSLDTKKRIAVEEIAKKLKELLHDFPEAESILSKIFSATKDEIFDNLQNINDELGGEITDISFVENIEELIQELDEEIKIGQETYRKWSNTRSNDVSEEWEKWNDYERLIHKIEELEADQVIQQKLQKVHHARVTQALPEGKSLDSKEMVRALSLYYTQTKSNQSNWQRKQQDLNNDLKRCDEKMDTCLNRKKNLNQKLDYENNKESFNLDNFQKQQIKKFEKNLKSVRNFMSDMIEVIDSDSGSNVNHKIEPLNNYIKNSFGNEILHGDPGEVRKIESVDYLNKKFILKGFGSVHFSSGFSTGRSMSGFIKGKLTNQDNKKIICFVDEALLMDDKSQKQVLTRLQELDDHGNLVFSLFASVENRKTLNLSYL